ncbi:MAG: 4-hydroxy-tetrahydrodipicolinate reductase, partial [Candidatus Eremiobacteraeota bacterium]|nr:4-hydroxy-tetrahydrodipicolinate reductase [Candidatus Eremiobacteraeota bacterium]
VFEKAAGARGADVDGIGVHSLRLPGVIANQDVALSNSDEMLIIRHVTLSRSAFVPGVLRAVRAVITSDRLIVGMDSLLA